MAEVLTRRVALRGAPLACMKARDDEVLLVGAAMPGFFKHIKCTFISAPYDLPVPGTGTRTVRSSP